MNIMTYLKKKIYSNPYYFYIWRLISNFRYEGGIDPLRLIYVDPSDIKFVSPFRTAHDHSAWLDHGKVKAEGWGSKQSWREFKELPVYQALHRRFVGGEEWDEINFWDQSAGRNDAIESLYENIRTEGFKIRKETLNAETPITEDRAKVNKFITSLDDVVVDIYSSGEILHRGCNHRVAIAKILELETIPVRVCIRHPQWMETRDKIHCYRQEGKSISDNDFPLSHPDIPDTIK